MSDEKGTVKTTYKALGLGGLAFGGVPCAVDYKDDKIIRVRPMLLVSKSSHSAHATPASQPSPTSLQLRLMRTNSVHVL